MSTNNICFHGQIQDKYLSGYPSYLQLWSLITQTNRSGLNLYSLIRSFSFCDYTLVPDAREAGFDPCSG